MITQQTYAMLYNEMFAACKAEAAHLPLPTDMTEDDINQEIHHIVRATLSAKIISLLEKELVAQ
jgi:hypothetical protein